MGSAWDRLVKPYHEADKAEGEMDGGRRVSGVLARRGSFRSQSASVHSADRSARGWSSAGSSCGADRK